MPSPNTLILPVALGLSLATVTALVVYYVFKKDDEESDGKSVKTSRVNVIEISVPKKIVPALIGRNGSNIKDIEKKTGALIHFKKFSDKDYDVCILRGRSDATQLAENLVHDFIKQQPDILDENMMVPSWACGRIIGSGGESINEISHRSGARIKVEGLSGSDGGTQRIVSIKGTKEQIVMAKGLIDNCVAQEKCRREIEQSKRNPRHIAPTPSPTSDRTETATSDNAGDVTKHAKYLRPESATPSSIEVFVSAVSSPSRFWVQFVGPQVTRLDELVNHMTDYYSSKENREAHALQQVCVGQVVAAVFRHDGRWYRARVHDIRPNEFDATKQVADVFFVDYGDSEYVGTHELCELRADLLRLRFQAMECFLAGVKPTSSQQLHEPAPGGWDRWDNIAIERFEELTQVARWKPLVSRTCTYRKTMAVDGDKEKEIPGIKLYDVTEEGELDIGATLIQEGLAVAADLSPRTSPPKPTTPFGDLGKSSILGIVSKEGSSRASSLPKDHKDDNIENSLADNLTQNKENDIMTTSKSLGSGLEREVQGPISNFDLSYPMNNQPTTTNLNGNFAATEKLYLNQEGSSDTLVETPIHTKTALDDLKANMNRIDSHHGNLEALGRHENHRN